MLGKSKEPLYCRYCGKGIKKYTTVVEVREVPGGELNVDTSWHRYLYLGKGNKLFNKADCQKHTNLKVISVNYWNGNVHSFHVWDGESYVDPYFCTGTCARLIGYQAAVKGWSTEQYAKRFKKKDVA